MANLFKMVEILSNLKIFHTNFEVLGELRLFIVKKVILTKKNISVGLSPKSGI
jgi:hypothetical protein